MLVLLLSATAAAAAGAGSVVGLAGSCFLDSGGNRRALTLGMEVAVGDTVEASQTGKLRLRMVDGSIVAVAPGTRLTITAYAVAQGGRRENATLSLTQGLLRAIVAPANRPASFEVETAISAAAARSTDWLVEATAARDRVVVLKGSVAVTGKTTGHSIVVAARHETSIVAGQDPQPPRPATRADVARLLARVEFQRPRRTRPRSERTGEPEYTEPSNSAGSYQPYPPAGPPPYQSYPEAPSPPPFYQPYPNQPYPHQPYPGPSYPSPPGRGSPPPGPSRGGGTPSYGR